MPKRRIFLFGGLALLVWLLLMGYRLMAESKDPLPLGEMLEIPAPDFEAVDLEGNKLKLSDFRGKIVFLNFWATWCPPCEEEMPLMQEIYEQYKDQGVVILAVSPTSVQLKGGTDDGEAERQVRRYIQEKGYTFPVILDKGSQAWKIYQQRGIPVNYVIDAKGVIRYGFMGPFQSKEQMEEFIANLRCSR